MSRPYFPTADDVAALLIDSGITTTAQQRESAVAAAIAQWGQATGFGDWPWLAETEDSEWVTSPSGHGLFFPGYVSITSVETGITYDSTTGDPIDGTVQVPNVGYSKVPFSGTPIRSLKWKRCIPCGADSIKITGKRGYSTTVPDDVWSAIRAQAAATAYAGAYNASTNGLKSINIGSGDLAVTFAGIESTAAGSWMQEFKTVASNKNYHAVSF